MTDNPIYQTVIVGGGFTGLFAALHLARDRYPRSVILIDRDRRFCFKPLLYEYFSGQMDSLQVVPLYKELLRGSGVIFVQDSVQEIDLQNREVKLASGNNYNYSNLVLALGSVTNYFNVEGAKEYALPLWTQADAIEIDRHLRDCLQKAIETEDPEQRRTLLTVIVIGGGPSGVEMAATLADLLPHWYAALGGDGQEIRIGLMNHGQEILEGDINSHLRKTAERELKKRAVKVEILMGAEATAIRPNEVEFKYKEKIKTANAATILWTTGTSVHPLIKDLAISQEHRDRRGRLLVTPTMQLFDYPEVFAGGDCAAVKDSSLPPTAQVAYQQGTAIARNLKALALEDEPQPAEVNIRGTLLKLGLEDAAANIYDKFELDGEIGHLIRQGTYLELLPTPIHDFKATTEWLKEEIFRQHLGSDGIGKTAVRAVQIAGGVALGVLAAQKLLQLLGDEEKSDRD